ncbi:response regulator [Desulfopila inferna]|uniref:response regulator n=1 Tax=Desulfopila inferna TaxID=468528 RepID=UPI001962DF20|nr:response regulator [Desulfopila inferna]MBM9603148.1 response regulator [Desulfopila inferna]
MKKILLVDDEENIRFIYEEELKEEGYEIISAANGMEALELFKEEKPDLVVLDIQMPGLNGIEVLRRMKTLDPSVPVILSSAYPEFKQDLGAWASEEYIVKSSDIQQLKDAVQRFIGK